MSREFAKVEREAEIAEALADGPLTVRGIAAMLLPDDVMPNHSLIAKITQSLRVMEREDIVQRTGKVPDVRWSLRRKGKSDGTARG